jgi:hypothetical protein
VINKFFFLLNKKLKWNIWKYIIKKNVVLIKGNKKIVKIFFKKG